MKLVFLIGLLLIVTAEPGLDMKTSEDADEVTMLERQNRENEAEMADVKEEDEYTNIRTYDSDSDKIDAEEKFREGVKKFCAKCEPLMKCRGCRKNGTKQQCENVCNNLESKVQNSRTCWECLEYVGEGVNEACAKCVPFQIHIENCIYSSMCSPSSARPACIQRKALCNNYNKTAKDIKKSRTCGECREHLKLQAIIYTY